MTTTGMFSHLARRPFEMVRVRERSKTEETGKEGKKERKKEKRLTWQMGRRILAQLRRNSQRALRCSSEGGGAGKSRAGDG